jgi:hypothetical protein
MNSKKDVISKIQENEFNQNSINDIIIKLSEEPKLFHFEVVDFLLNKLKKEELQKININLIYLLGELGNLTKLKQKYTQYLYESFYISDRWIRSEILKVLEKNIEIVKSDNNIILLISSALKEEYETNNLIALRILLKLDKFPDIIFKSFITVLNKGKSELKGPIGKILEKHFHEEALIFSLLDQNKNYRILKSSGLRLILQSLFPLINRIENFQKLIETSEWETEKKSTFLKEIKIIISLANRI